MKKKKRTKRSTPKPELRILPKLKVPRDIVAIRLTGAFSGLIHT